MLRRHGKQLFILILSSMSLSIAQAADFVMTLSGGPSWERAGEAQTLTLAPDVVKTYTNNNSSNVLPSGELFLGIQHILPRQLQGQLGLALLAAGNATVSGDVWDDADPLFDNYTYEYNVSRTAVALKSKIIAQWDWPVMPWVSATIGAGFNKAYGFQNTPTIDEAIPMPNFASETTTAFTYAVGVGIQHPFDVHWQIGVGYEFSDWGKSELGSTGSDVSGETLSLSHLYTHSILFNLTYLA